MFTYEQIESLNELELQIYNYIIRNYDRVLNMKIRELSDTVHVSTSTILRFCKKMECQGYSEFKLKLQFYLKEKPTQISLSDSNLMLEYFKRIDNEEFEKKLNDVVKLISHSTQVIFIGIGTSGILAKYASRCLTNVGKFAHYIDYPFFAVPKGFYDGAVIVALSVSGETEHVINHINRFKSFNCATVSITNSETSTIAKISDLVLSYYVPLEIVTDAKINLTTQVPVVYMIEQIAKKVHIYLQKNQI